MHLGSKARFVVVFIGVVQLFFSLNKILILYDYLFAPSIRKKLILNFSLFKQGYFILFNKNISIKLNRSFICSGKLIDSLYLITPKMYL